MKSSECQYYASLGSGEGDTAPTAVKASHGQRQFDSLTESSIPAVNSVRLVYYSNRTLSSASIGTSIRFGSRSKISSGEAIRLANARYGSVRFEDVRYGEPTLIKR